ncbi:hypothetical protein [Streptomyces sp. NEAU-174]|uniref:hypothetical protein n=1 Tax=Streptomyces sp. NEAU-174 TaxID=3458254 RepID=UPI004044B4A3
MPSTRARSQAAACWAVRVPTCRQRRGSAASASARALRRAWSARGVYGRAWISVKHVYGPAVAPAERSSLEGMLATRA